MKKVICTLILLFSVLTLSMEEDNLYKIVKELEKSDKVFSEKEVFDMYLSAAQKGSVHSQFRIGRMYLYGKGVKKDISLAIKWFEKASEKGHGDAFFNLGIIYYTGNQVKRNYEKSYGYFEKAAAKGYYSAMYNLGLFNKHGQGTKKNILKAIEYLKQSDHKGKNINSLDIKNMSKVKMPIISNNGKHIVFYNIENEDSDLYIVSTENDKHPKRLTYGKGYDISPSWSYDNERIAYVSIDEKYSIKMINMEGGKPKVLVTSNSPILGLGWMKNQEKLLYITEKSISTDIEDVNSQIKYYELYEYNIIENETTKISLENESILSFYFDPEEKNYAFIKGDNLKKDYSYQKTDLFINKDGVNSLVDNSVFDIVGWNKDGKGLYYLKYSKNFQWKYLVFYNMDKNIKTVYNDYKKNIVGYFKPEKSSDVFFTYQEDLKYKLCKFKNNTFMDIAELKTESITNSSFSLDEKGEKIAFIKASENEPPNIYYIDLTKNIVKQKSYFNVEAFGWSFGKEEIVKYESENKILSGVLIKPINFNKDKKYPLVIQVHGGPISWWEGWHLGSFDWGQLLANKGYMVFLPNLRVSEAYGKRDINWFDYGFGSVEDIKSAVKVLKENRNIDSSKIGICGSSYGGFITALSIGNSDLFKTAIVLSGITNYKSEYGTIDYKDLFFSFFNNKNPYEHKNIFEKISPINYADKVNSSVLIIQGKNDKRVPYSQAMEYFNALQFYNVKSELILYKKEGHVFSSGDNVMDINNRVVDWFENNLK